jgi:hypothetical protein
MSIANRNVDHPNATRQDAWDTVLRGRLGSVAGVPTVEYLESLLTYIDQWEAEVRSILKVVEEREARQELESRRTAAARARQVVAGMICGDAGRRAAETA